MKQPDLKYLNEYVLTIKYYFYASVEGMLCFTPVCLSIRQCFYPKMVRLANLQIEVSLSAHVEFTSCYHIYVEFRAIVSINPNHLFHTI